MKTCLEKFTGYLQGITALHYIACVPTAVINAKLPSIQILTQILFFMLTVHILLRKWPHSTADAELRWHCNTDSDVKITSAVDLHLGEEYPSAPVLSLIKGILCPICVHQHTKCIHGPNNTDFNVYTAVSCKSYGGISDLFPHDYKQAKNRNWKDASPCGLLSFTLFW